MANISTTAYVVVFRENEEAEEMKNRMMDNDCDYIKYKRFIGVERENSECGPHTIYRKDDVSVENGNELHFETESQWNTDEGVERFFRNNYEGCRVYFLETEVFESVFYTNDKEGVFFPYKYHVEYDSDVTDGYGSANLRNKEEVIELFNHLFNTDCVTLDDVEDMAEDLEGTDTFLMLEIDYEL